jgi:hypothetical protein
MWQTVELSSGGKWMKAQRFASLDEARSSVGTEASQRFHFPTEPMPAGKTERQQRFNEVNAANEGRILRMIAGVSIVTMGGGCNCPGECFCVHQDGGCHCEAYYCENGVCWVVNCPGNC